MTDRMRFRVTVIGFLLLYVASVGSLVVVSMPILNNLETEILWYVALPAGLLGLALVIFEKVHARVEQ